ncbi:MAG: hypothetical protein LBK69_07325 [Syntrophomonadaceae bacterium]|nr:hypothetical protein [Syntrophomonadaceae bacterium]
MMTIILTRDNEAEGKEKKQLGLEIDENATHSMYSVQIIQSGILPDTGERHCVWLLINGKEEIMSWFPKLSKLHNLVGLRHCVRGKKHAMFFEQSLKEICDRTKTTEFRFTYFPNALTYAEHIFIKNRGDLHFMWSEGIDKEYELCGVTHEHEAVWREKYGLI